MYENTTRPAHAMVVAARELATALRGTDMSQPWHFKAGVVPGAAELRAGLVERAGPRGEAGSGGDTAGPTRMPVRGVARILSGGAHGGALRYSI